MRAPKQSDSPSGYDREIRPHHRPAREWPLGLAGDAMFGGWERFRVLTENHMRSGQGELLGQGGRHLSARASGASDMAFRTGDPVDSEHALALAFAAHLANLVSEGLSVTAGDPDA